ncbi:hypothetical protein EHQ81_01870 [Leptospira selangorensis]|uniref:Glycosyltransferase RgtA/B/C/D-like domain-containing protein n=1 Tax=Leptospira selangorensis TaxID=2484982 RepID=A0A5F2BVN8_9LEPT|nr:hypothetical protein [Leptospira selangorensis]TGM11973.1 hypothetical protein EHQ82_20745 [Leptospira selangorensis]TGM15166.1 hypothetical protein EHQ81_01870 [Leptospira selangorensis]
MKENIKAEVILNKTCEYCIYFSSIIFSMSFGRIIGYNGRFEIPWYGITFSVALLLIAIIIHRKFPIDLNLDVLCKLSISIILGLYTFLFFQTEDYTRHYFEVFKLPCLLSILFIIMLLAFRQRKEEKGSIWRSIAVLSAKNPFYYFCIPIFLCFTYSSVIFARGDSIPAKLYPFTIFSEGNLDLNEFFPPPNIIKAEHFVKKELLVETVTKLPSGDFFRQPYYLVWKDAKVLGSYPILPGLMNSIVYGFIKLAGIELPHPGVISQQNPIPFSAFYLEKFTAGAIAALTSMFFFRAILRLISFRSSLILSLLFSFASSHLSVSSQALWQHGLIEMLLTLSLPYVLVSNVWSRQRLLFFGLLLGTFYFVRPSGIIIAFIIGLLFGIMNKLYLIHNNSKLSQVSWISSGVLFAGIFFSLLNFYFYGDIQGGYNLFKTALANDGIDSLFAWDFWSGFSGLLWSPSYGVFIFCPIVILSIFGPFISKGRLKITLACLTLCALGYLFLYSPYKYWWGGGSYGARFFSDLSPIFFVLLIPIFKLARKIKILKVLVILFASISIWAHSSAVYLGGFLVNWQACNQLPDEVKSWDWTRIPYTQPFRKYYPLVTSEFDIQPVSSCQMGRLSGLINDRYAYRFDKDSLFADEYEKILQDTTIYFRKGNYCLTVFGAVMKEESLPDKDNLRIIISQNKKEILNYKETLRTISPNYFPSINEFEIPSSGKVGISIERKTGKSIDFAGLRIKEGACNLVRLKMNQGGKTFLVPD